MKPCSLIIGNHCGKVANFCVCLGDHATLKHEGSIHMSYVDVNLFDKVSILLLLYIIEKRPPQANDVFERLRDYHGEAKWAAIEEHLKEIQMHCHATLNIPESNFLEEIKSECINLEEAQNAVNKKGL